MTTLVRIRELMVRRFELRAEALEAGAPLRGLGIDSLAITEFMFELEDEFGIRLPYERMAIDTLGDIAEAIDRLVAEQRVRAA